MKDPFFNGDELWSGPKRLIPGDSDSWDALAEYCSSKVAPLLERLQYLESGLKREVMGAQCSEAMAYQKRIQHLETENTRLNAQVRTLGEQVEDAKITISSLRALLARARVRVFDGSKLAEEIDAALGEK